MADIDFTDPKLFDRFFERSVLEAESREQSRRGFIGPLFLPPMIRRPVPPVWTQDWWAFQHGDRLIPDPDAPQTLEWSVVR